MLLPHQVRVGLGVKTMKEYSRLPKDLELKPHQQMKFSVICEFRPWTKVFALPFRLMSFEKAMSLSLLSNYEQIVVQTKFFKQPASVG